MFFDDGVDHWRFWPPNKSKKKDVRRNCVYVETICSDSYSDNDDMFVYLFELIWSCWETSPSPSPSLGTTGDWTPRSLLTVCVLVFEVSLGTDVSYLSLSPDHQWCHRRVFTASRECQNRAVNQRGPAPINIIRLTPAPVISPLTSGQEPTGIQLPWNRSSSSQPWL